MWSLAWRMAIFTQNSSEYPKTSGAIPRGLRPLGIAPSVFGYSLIFSWIFCQPPRETRHIATVWMEWRKLLASWFCHYWCAVVGSLEREIRTNKTILHFTLHVPICRKSKYVVVWMKFLSSSNSRSISSLFVRNPRLAQIHGCGGAAAAAQRHRGEQKIIPAPNLFIQGGPWVHSATYEQ